MRVLCINGDFSGRAAYRYLLESPKELEEYTVRETVDILGRTGYILNEIFGGIIPTTGNEISFDSSRFVRLQEINTLEETIEELEPCLIDFQ